MTSGEGIIIYLLQQIAAGNDVANNWKRLLLAWYERENL